MTTFSSAADDWRMKGNQRISEVQTYCPRGRKIQHFTTALTQMNTSLARDLQTLSDDMTSFEQPQYTDRQVLRPYDRREALSLRRAAEIAGRSETTVRSWCANHDIGRRVANGPWQVSAPALHMWLDGDGKALAAYLAGDRMSSNVVTYFQRCGLADLLPAMGTRRN